MKRNKKGFTLIELIIAMAILAILSGFIVGGVLNSLKKGRDAERKQDLASIQKALELYYADNGAYPANEPDIYGSNDQFCAPAGCSTKIYMVKVPKDPVWNCQYDYDAIGSGYAMYAPLENDKDQGEGVKQSGWSGCTLSTNCCPGKYAVTSPDVTPP